MVICCNLDPLALSLFVAERASLGSRRGKLASAITKGARPPIGSRAGVCFCSKSQRRRPHRSCDLHISLGLSSFALIFKIRR